MKAHEEIRILLSISINIIVICYSVQMFNSLYHCIFQGLPLER